MLLKLNVDKLMQNKNLTIEKLSKISNINKDVISRYKRDIVDRLDKTVIVRLCIALQCDISDLLEFKEISEDK
jgi:putative transcriptional regulator